MMASKYAFMYALAMALAGVIAVLALSRAYFANPLEIVVQCETSTCFGRIEEAVTNAPEGAILEIRAGTYYEYPLSLTKTLTLKGEDPRTTRIHAVKPGALFAVHTAENPVRVSIEGLALGNFIVSPDGPLSSVLRVEKGSSEDKSSVSVSLQGVWLTSAELGIWTQGEIRLEIRSSEIYAQKMPVVRVAEGGTLVLEESRLSATSDAAAYEPGLLVLLSSDAELRENLLIPFGEVRVPFGIYGSDGEYSLTENELAFVEVGLALLGTSTRASLRTNYFHDLKTGVTIGGEVNSTLVENVFRYNDVGVLLYLPPCASSRGDDPLRFRGVVSGRDNRFEYNDTDLCPEDYPWPEGFEKP
jgi:nitrous oxidase accessory protein NosD